MSFRPRPFTPTTIWPSVALLLAPSLVLLLDTTKLLTVGGVSAVDSDPFEHHSSSSLSIDEIDHTIDIAEQHQGLSIHDDDDKDPIINEPQEDSNKQDLSKSLSQVLHLRGPRSVNNSDGGSVDTDEHVELKVENGVLLVEDHDASENGITNDSSKSIGRLAANAEIYDPVDDADTTEKLVRERVPCSLLTSFF